VATRPASMAPSVKAMVNLAFQGQARVLVVTPTVAMDREPASIVPSVIIMEAVECQEAVTRTHLLVLINQA